MMNVDDYRSLNVYCHDLSSVKYKISERYALSLSCIVGYVSSLTILVEFSQKVRTSTIKNQQKSKFILPLGKSFQISFNLKYSSP
jgi:hypothetical protein